MTRGCERRRDVDGETQRALAALDLSDSHTLLEIGAGTGDLAIAAAKTCRRVYAVDISETMLSLARNKAGSQRVSNIEFIHAGFLSYQHQSEPVDAAASQLALHHLPDFWKAVALCRISDALRPGGRFFLRDVVFSFSPRGADTGIEAWVASAFCGRR